MASLFERGDAFIVQYTNDRRQRKTIHLGPVSKRFANEAREHVEKLAVAVKIRRPPEADTTEWLAGIPDELAEKLADHGLIAKREAATLAAFLEAYIAKRSDVKASTATVLGHTKRCLIEYFGAGKRLRDITTGDGEEWRIWLVENQKLSDNTVRRRCGIAKQFFHAAIKRRLLTENPFRELAAAVRANKSRVFFIKRDVADKVLAACPNAQWRLLFALSRYGGLRCPSEHLALKWDDIDWERGRMRVPSPKTAHHEGKAERFVPIFPELRPYLDAAWDEAEPGSEFVISIRRDIATNLRTRMQKIIRRAGVKPWPKLFHNLRSTRETELAETFPLHVVCQWIGNSQPIAVEHYLQVTDEHFERATKPALHFALQHCSASDAAAVGATKNPAGFHGVRGNAVPQMGGEGLEPPTSSV